MISVITVKEGVKFDIIAPGGFRILSAVEQVGYNLGVNLRITSGTDGEHSGPSDPHHSGNALDVGSKEHNNTLKQQILEEVMKILGYEYFYGFLEAAGTDNEHFHFQVKKGTIYPPV